MKYMTGRALLTILLSTLALLSQAFGQTADSASSLVTVSASATVPRLIQFSAIAKDASGKPLTGTLGITFLLYREEQGGAPLWVETQNVQADARGHYSVQLGATKASGLPVDVFASGEARWLGVQIADQPEQPRVLLLSVPYALKAADAETIGGLPPSAFVMAAASNAAGAASTQSSTTAPLPAGTTPVTTAGGKVNQVTKFDASADVTNSIITDTGTRVGINTTNPGATLDVNGASTIRGTLNLPSAGTASSAGGKTSQPLDQIASSFNSGTGKAVSQEFRWLAEPAGNNTANPSGTFNLLFGSNGTTPAETGLKIASNGQITFAAGQTLPVLQSLTVSGNVQAQFGNFTASNTGDILIVQNENTSGGIGLVSQANGSNGIGMEGNAFGIQSTGVQGSSSGANGVGVSGSGGTGVKGTGAFPTSIGVEGIGGTQSTSFGVIGTSGGVGVSGNGNTTPGSGGIGVAGLGSVGVSGSGGTTGTGVEGKGATGVSGTGIGLGVEGFANAAFSQGVAGVAQHQGVVGIAEASSGNHQGVFAQAFSPTGTGTLSVAVAESKTGQSLIGCCAIGVWGDTNQTTGGAAGLAGTADDAQAIFLGNNSTTHLTANIQNFENTTHNVQIMNVRGAFGSCNMDTDGNLGCSGNLFGNTFQGNGVAIGNGNISIHEGNLTVGLGNINVGGCIIFVGGTDGNCASDVRLKKNIRAYAGVLDKLVRLQPVSFDWRTAEYPDRQLGSSRSSGLIAQEVEKVFPEMVSIDKDGYRKVDYGRLPYLMLQGIRELKAQKDAQIRKQQKQIASLTQRIVELQRKNEQVQKLTEQVEQLRESQRAMSALMARIEAQQDSTRAAHHETAEPGTSTSLRVAAAHY